MPPQHPLPKIVLIDPPVDLTQDNRSVTVQAVPEIDVIGQVTAPAGVLHVKVNNRPVAMNAKGLFRIPIALGNGPTPVHVVAIDNEGHRAVGEFTLIPVPPVEVASVTHPTTLPSPPAPVVHMPVLNFGRYHALIIGINAYIHLPLLQTAVHDALGVAEMLQNNYDFAVKVLTDPTRAQIVAALDTLRTTLAKQDNLLIYYAGHGFLDTDEDRGYWLPVDAHKDTRINWLANTTVTDTLKALKARHVMVVADSCYAGTLVRDRVVRVVKAETERDVYFTRLAKKRARIALVSGGLEPVTDKGGGNHSVFAKAFLDALEENRGVMDGQEFFTKIRRPVMLNSYQTPEYTDTRFAGHEGGDFLFVRRPASQ